MAFSAFSLLIYLLGSMVFCLIAMIMLRSGAGFAAFSGVRKKDPVVPVAVFLFILAISTLIRFGGAPHLGQPVKNVLDYSLAVLMAVVVVSACLIRKDTIGSIGLSLRGAENFVFFLMPAAALMFFPGHFLNWNLIAESFSSPVAAYAFSEELLIRGYLQTRLEKAYGGNTGLFAASAAYTLLQVPMAIGSLRPAALPAYLFGSFIIWGCLAGMIYKKAGNIYGLTLFKIFWDIALRAFGGIALG